MKGRIQSVQFGRVQQFGNVSVFPLFLEARAVVVHLVLEKQVDEGAFKRRSRSCGRSSERKIPRERNCRKRSDEPGRREVMKRLFFMMLLVIAECRGEDPCDRCYHDDYH